MPKTPYIYVLWTPCSGAPLCVLPWRRFTCFTMGMSGQDRRAYTPVTRGPRRDGKPSVGPHKRAGGSPHEDPQRDGKPSEGSSACGRPRSPEVTGYPPAGQYWLAARVGPSVTMPPPTHRKHALKRAQRTKSTAAAVPSPGRHANHPRRSSFAPTPAPATRARSPHSRPRYTSPPLRRSTRRGP